MSELRKDPVTGRWVIISAERRKRPTDFRMERQTVIRDDHCPFFGWVEPGNRQRWDLGPPEPLGRLKPAMAGKDRTGLIDQHGVGPDPLDVLHQAGDLSFRMFPRVVPERL